MAHWGFYKIWPIEDFEATIVLYSREENSERTVVSNLQTCKKVVGKRKAVQCFPAFWGIV